MVFIVPILFIHSYFMILVPFLSCWLHMMWMCGAVRPCLLPEAAMRSSMHAVLLLPLSVLCGWTFALCASVPRLPRRMCNLALCDAPVSPCGFYAGVHQMRNWRQMAGRARLPGADASPHCECWPDAGHNPPTLAHYIYHHLHFPFLLLSTLGISL